MNNDVKLSKQEDSEGAHETHTKRRKNGHKDEKEG